jgi:hypothetical protein
LKDNNWFDLATRTGRLHSLVADECARATVATNHHEWVDLAASKLVLSGETLWQAMCAIWAKECLQPDDAAKIVQPIEDALLGMLWKNAPALVQSHAPASPPPAAPKAAPSDSSSGTLPLFEQ